MRALIYLLIITLKNSLLSLKKKPAYLISCILIVAFFAFFLITSLSMDNLGATDHTFVDIRILYAIIAGVSLIFIYSSIAGGLSKGSTLFNMADVGILFVSPVSPKKILVYGLIKQMGTTLFTSVFILFQIVNIKSNFNINNMEIFFIFIIYAIILFFTHLLTMAIYVFTSGNAKRKNLVKMIAAIFVGFFAILLYIEYQKVGGTFFDILLTTIAGKPFQFIPIAGWIVMLFMAIVEGNMIYIIVSCFLFLFSTIGMINLFNKGDGDYYEDVLVSTETKYIAMQNAKEGKMGTSTKPIKVKGNHFGLKKGMGASTLFYKHILEEKRKHRFIYIDTFTIMSAIGAGLICYFMKIEESVYTVLGILVYIQFFMTILGPLAQELKKPYIYMIPEKSIKKIIYSSMSSIRKTCIDGLIIFTVVCLVSRTSPILNLFLALAYGASGTIFISYTILNQRIMGLQPNKLVQSIFGIILFILVMSPGIGLSVVAVAMLPGYLTFLGTLPYTLSCIIISILIFILCGNLIDKAEMS